MVSEVTCRSLPADGRMAEDMDKVFKAVADRSRRQVLDQLHERNGQTLGELSSQLAMQRSST